MGLGAYQRGDYNQKVILLKILRICTSCQHKIHSKEQMPKLSTDLCWCLHTTCLSVSTQGTARACTYHLAALRNPKCLTFKKPTKINCIRRAISDAQTHQPLHFFKLYEHEPIQLMPSEYRRSSWSLFLGVYYLISRMPVTDLECMEGEFLGTSVLEVLWSIDSLWRASRFQVSELWHTCWKEFFSQWQNKWPSPIHIS